LPRTVCLLVPDLVRFPRLEHLDGMTIGMVP
jgi:hypothetical protein